MESPTGAWGVKCTHAVTWPCKSALPSAAVDVHPSQPLTRPHISAKPLRHVGPPGPICTVPPPQEQTLEFFVTQDTQHLQIAMEGLQQIQLLLPPLLSTQRASWEQGVAGQAILEVLLSTAIRKDHSTFRSTIFRYLYGLCHDALLRASDDGRLATRINSDDHGSGDGGALDPACIVESVYYVLAEIEGSVETSPEDLRNIANWRGKVDGMMDYLVNRAQRMMLSPEELADGTLPEEGVLSHLAAPRPCQIWSDGVYMGPPALAAHALSSSSPSSNLLDSALDQIILMTHYLRLPSGLLAHNYDCTARAPPSPSPNGGMYGARAWGVGSGWVCAGIVRVFRNISAHIDSVHWVNDWLNTDATGPRRIDRVHTILLDLLDACLAYQRADGLFHNVIDDNTTFVEANLAQMLAATLYRLLELHRTGALGLPPLEGVQKERYERAAGAMCVAARRKVDRYGFVRDVCGSPRFNVPGTAAEGQAWGVLMEVARGDWEGKKAGLGLGSGMGHIPVCQ